MIAAGARWNGWGLDALYRERFNRPKEHWDGYAQLLGLPEAPLTPAVALETIGAPATRLTDPQRRALEAILGPGGLLLDARSRLKAALGQSYHDLLRKRAGLIESPPDAAALPPDEASLEALMRFAQDEGLVLTPQGGLTSVVGGANTPSSPRPVLAVSLRALNRLVRIDRDSLIAEAEAGVSGPELEAALGREGLTLGHFPQSFEFSTLGGWIAHRGAGQQSGRYGKAESWFAGARMISPAGPWDTEDFPASAAGPQARDLVLGSEGTLGFIARARVRVRPAAELFSVSAFLVPSFERGAEIVRALAQARLPLSMIRLSDADETLLQHSALLEGAAAGSCLLLIGCEGSPDAVAAQHAAASAYIAQESGAPLGPETGEHWKQGRFEGPYQRDPMLDHGLGVDTLETAARWSDLPRLYSAVRSALQETMAASSPGGSGVVLGHISHCYPDGASLYFTYVFMRDLADELGQWRRIKAAASDAIAAHRGTISHHHGVGEDHLPWMAAEKGPIALVALRAVKDELDPMGIMNPGTLLPAPPA